MTVEEWRAIPGYEGFYEVSDAGQVRRVGRRILKPSSHNGYLKACLSVGDRKKYHQVHNLVLAAFIGPKPDRWQAAHGDGDRANNRLSNLSYKTREANEADKIAHGTSQHGSRNGFARLKEDDVREIRRRIVTGERLRIIASDFGVSRDLISKIKLGKAWGHLDRASPTSRKEQK